jgi:hypothetical protein
MRRRKSSLGLSTSDRPLTDFRWVDEQGHDLDDDMEDEAWSLILRVSTIKAHIYAAWRRYAIGGISLITVSALTS